MFTSFCTCVQHLTFCSTSAATTMSLWTLGTRRSPTSWTLTPAATSHGFSATHPARAATRCRTHCIGLHRTGLYRVQILFALHSTVDWVQTRSALHQNNVTTKSSTQTAHHLKVCLSMTTSRCPSSPPTFVPAWPLGITLEWVIYFLIVLLDSVVHMVAFVCKKKLWVWSASWKKWCGASSDRRLTWAWEGIS